MSCAFGVAAAAWSRKPSRWSLGSTLLPVTVRPCTAFRIRRQLTLRYHPQAYRACLSRLFHALSWWRFTGLPPACSLCCCQGRLFGVIPAAPAASARSDDSRERVSPCGVWCRNQGSNPRPADYKSAALPSELYRHDLVQRPGRDLGVSAFSLHSAGDWLDSNQRPRMRSNRLSYNHHANTDRLPLPVRLRPTSGARVCRWIMPDRNWALQAYGATFPAS